MYFERRIIISGYSKKARERFGESNTTRFGSIYTIIDKPNNQGESGIYVQFQDEHAVIVHTSYDMFKAGKVKNPYDRSLYGHGYVGEGDYPTSRGNSKPDYKYLVWQGILRRCYDEKFNNTKPTYKGCSMCDEWMNYQTFAKWFENNYYEVGNERMHLDKDIVYKHNKIYSPETCVIVPQRINALFVNNHARRGAFPVGVCESSTNGKYLSVITLKGKNKHLGTFSSIDEAFAVYKLNKEKLIKEVADGYKNKIPSKLYDAMYRYEIEIND